jgi:Cu2+-exporting ATPase
MNQFQQVKKTSKTLRNKCLHCGEQFSFEGEFCCRGCQTAYELVKNLGLSKFYDHRKNLTSDTIKLAQSESAEFDFSNFISEEDGVNSLELLTGGVSCSSCIWLIESALNKQEEITSARLNLSTKRLKFSWKGDKSLGNKFAAIIMKMGYSLKPFDATILGKEFEDEQKDLLKKIVVSGFALVAVMMFADGLWVQSRAEIGAATQDILHWLLILIGVPAVIYSGSFFFVNALKGLRTGNANMDLPIASSLLVIIGLSFYQTIIGSEHIYLDSAVMLTFSLLVGRYFDHKSRYLAKSSALEMTEMLSGFATLITSSGNKIISTKELKQGDLVLIATGDKIPADATIIKGEAEFDTSMITGESLPKSYRVGDYVFAGSINLGQNIEVLIAKESKNSEAAKILELLEEAEKTKSGYSLLAEKATHAYIPLVYGAAAITFILWYFFLDGGLQNAIIYSACVLVVTCPCALGLAIPVVNVLAFSKMYKNGLLLKKGETLENLAKIDIAIFDKTGTLTEGNFTIKNLDEFTDEELKIAASLAIKSRHPISQAIAESYKKPLYNDIKVEEVKGNGLIANFKKQKIMLGKPIWCGEKYSGKKSGNILCLKINKSVKFFILEDRLREDAKATISKIKSLGINTKILSGDILENVKKIAKNVGIDEYFAALLPEQKYKFIENLKASGKKVLMVGDGLNDAPAVALADVSISPGSAISITQNSADIIFKGKKLDPVLRAILISKRSIVLIRQNIFLSFLYNFIAIPYAMFGFLTPVWAAIAMSLSSIIVVLNSMRLGR